jgi:UDP-N-acetylglucosamine 2-epimerase
MSGTRTSEAISSATSAPPPSGKAISQAVVSNWLGELRSAMQAASCAELLDFDGVNALDVLLNPLHLALLYALRGGEPQPQPPARKILGRLHQWAFDGKVAIRQRVAAQFSAPVREVDVLLWTRDITHTVHMQPVAAELGKMGVPCAMLACQSKTFLQLRRRGIGAVYTLGAWPHVVREAQKEGLRRARLLAADGPWPLPPLDHPLAHVMERVVRATVIRQLPVVSETVANARAALEQFRCRVLVVGNDLTMEGRAGCLVAASHGVPTAVFMHGNITGSSLVSLHCADYQLVYGDVHRRELMDHGMGGERIVVCGAASLDGLQPQTGRIHPALRSRLGLSPGKPWILVATSGPGHSVSHAHHRQVVDNLFRLSAAIPEVPIVVKLHRKDKFEFYRQGLKDCTGKFFVVKQAAFGFPRDIFDWLQGCTMVLTGSSTAAVDAMVMGVPVITMDFCGEIQKVDFIDRGATVHVRTAQELEAAVRGILAAGGLGDDVGARAAAYLQGAFLALDGRSAQRGAEALRAVALHGRPQ